MRGKNVPASGKSPGQARHFRLLCRPGFLTGGLLLSLFLLAPIQANGSPVSLSPAHQELERAVWLEDPDRLPEIEIRAARVVQEDPYSAWGHYLLAQLYLRQFKDRPSQLKLLKQAAELGQQAVDLAPQRDYGYLISAQVLDLMGYTENALGVLLGGEQRNMKPSWRTFFLKGQLLNGQIADEKILALFEQSVTAPDTIPDIVVPYLIATLQASHQGQGLVKQLESWRLRQPHRLIELSLAIALADQKQYDEAHKIYNRLQKQYQTFREAFINDAVLLYTQLGRQNEAEKLLMGLIEREQDLDPFKRSLVRAHMGKLLLTKTQRFDEARRHFVAAISHAKQPMEWVSFSHQAYEQQRRLEDFILVLDQLREEIPGSSVLYALQGEVLSERLARHDQAIESFRAAILLDPKRSEFYNGLGLTYYRMNKLESALQVFSQATRVDPQDATSRYNEACVLAILGRSDEALGSLREAILLDPRLQQTARSDKDFDSLRQSESFRALTETHSSAATKAP